jgi:hypothetical protein
MGPFAAHVAFQPVAGLRNTAKDLTIGDNKKAPREVGPWAGNAIARYIEDHGITDPHEQRRLAAYRGV